MTAILYCSLNNILFFSGGQCFAVLVSITISSYLLRLSAETLPHNSYFIIFRAKSFMKTFDGVLHACRKRHYEVEIYYHGGPASSIGYLASQCWTGLGRLTAYKLLFESEKYVFTFMQLLCPDLLVFGIVYEFTWWSLAVLYGDSWCPRMTSEYGRLMDDYDSESSISLSWWKEDHVKVGWLPVRLLSLV